MIQEHVREQMGVADAGLARFRCEVALQGVATVRTELGGLVGVAVLVAIASWSWWRRRQIAAWWIGVPAL